MPAPHNAGARAPNRHKRSASVHSLMHNSGLICNFKGLEADSLTVVMLCLCVYSQLYTGRVLFFTTKCAHSMTATKNPLGLLCSGFTAQQTESSTKIHYKSNELSLSFNFSQPFPVNKHMKKKNKNTFYTNYNSSTTYR